MNRTFHLLILVFELAVLTVGMVVFENEIVQYLVDRLYPVQIAEEEPGSDAMEEFIRSIVLDDITLKYGRKGYLYEIPWSFSEAGRDLVNLRLRIVSHDESVVRAEPYGGVRAVGEGTTAVELYDTGEYPHDAVGKLLDSCSVAVEGGIPDQAAEAEYTVGDIGPGGGFVFHDAGDCSRGWRYLEVAPDYWTWRGYDQPLFWADIPFNEDALKRAGDFPAADTSPFLGEGRENTRKIVDFFGPGEYPAYICDELVLNGKDDWFLPSAEEMEKLMEFLGQRPNVNGAGGDRPIQLSSSGEYWSSTLDDSFAAWTGNAGSLKMEIMAIVNEGFFRPIRAF